MSRTLPREPTYWSNFGATISVEDRRSEAVLHRSPCRFIKDLPPHQDLPRMPPLRPVNCIGEHLEIRGWPEEGIGPERLKELQLAFRARIDGEVADSMVEHASHITPEHPRRWATYDRAGHYRPSRRSKDDHLIPWHESEGEEAPEVVGPHKIGCLLVHGHFQWFAGRARSPSYRTAPQVG